MLFRQAGIFHTNYASDRALFPIAADRWMIGVLLAFGLAAPLVGGPPPEGVAGLHPHRVVGKEIQILVHLAHVDHVLHPGYQVPDCELSGDALGL